MSDLSPNLVLKRLPDVKVRINSDKHIQIVADDIGVDRLMIDDTITVNAASSGTHTGLLVYFELDLGPSMGLSTRPAQADADCSGFGKA